MLREQRIGRKLQLKAHQVQQFDETLHGTRWYSGADDSFLQAIQPIQHK